MEGSAFTLQDGQAYLFKIPNQIKDILYNRSQDEDDPERQESDEFTGEVTINLNPCNGEVGGM